MRRAPFFDEFEHEGCCADLQRRGDFAHVGVADDAVKPAVLGRVRVRLIARVDDRAPVHGIDGDQHAEEVGALRDLKNPGLRLTVFAFQPHLARAGEDLAGDEEWHDP